MEAYASNLKYTRIMDVAMHALYPHVQKEQTCLFGYGKRFDDY